MTNRKERQSDGGVSLRHHPPRQILYHAVVFVLAGTIIGVEEGVLLSKAMMVKNIVQLTDHSICTLATISCFIRQEVNLPGECLTVDTKHSALPGCQKVDGARLLRVRWIVHLLSIIRGIVYLARDTCRVCPCACVCSISECPWACLIYKRDGVSLSLSLIRQREGVSLSSCLIR